MDWRNKQWRLQKMKLVPYFYCEKDNSKIKTKINDSKSHQHGLLDLHRHFRSVNGIFCCGRHKAFAAGHPGNT